jgi:hypothetical protein
MEQNQVGEKVVAEFAELSEAGNSALDLSTRETAVLPQSGCSTALENVNGNAVSVYIYAIGRIEPRFPTLAAEKEYAQAVGRANTKGQTDLQIKHSILSQKQNRYLARQMCWVMTIEGLETYILKPRHSGDLDMLIEAIRSVPNRNDVDIVIGSKGPIAPPEMCNGLMVPIVFFDQIYSFDVDSLIKSIPRPEKKEAKDFEPAATELFERIMQMADNAGASDEHRALNYLAVRYITRSIP